MLVEPYTYVRVVTIGLGTVWTLGGIYRTYRFYCRWKNRLVPLGFEKSWLRLQVRTFVLRSTVLDPVNLSLMLVVLGVGVLRWSMARNGFGV